MQCRVTPCFSVKRTVWAQIKDWRLFAFVSFAYSKSNDWKGGDVNLSFDRAAFPRWTAAARIDPRETETGGIECLQIVPYSISLFPLSGYTRLRMVALITTIGSVCEQINRREISTRERERERDKNKDIKRDRRRENIQCQHRNHFTNPTIKSRIIFSLSATVMESASFLALASTLLFAGE